jgi:hypothetical protein
MKSILLASASAFAFAGAAAADVAWSGSAAAEYNLPVGSSNGATTTTVKLGAAASVAGDWTLSTSIAMSAAGAWTTGAVSLTDGTSTLTFGSNASGNGHADGAFTAVKQAYTTTTTTTADDTVDVSVSTDLGGVALSLTGDTSAAADDWQLGASMSMGGIDIDAGFGVMGANQGDIAINASTTMGAATVGMNLLTENGTTTTDVSGSFTMDALTLSIATDNLTASGDYDASVKYSMGDLTLSGSVNEDQAWNIGTSYKAGDATASGTYYSTGYFKASVGYTMDALKIAASTRTDTNAMSVSGSYDMGNGMTVFAGSRTVTAAEAYAGLSATLGAATVSLSYSNTGAGKASATTYEKEYKAGTTLGVAFKF